MIEVNRSLYMDEQTGERLSCFEGTAHGIQQALLSLITRISR